MGFSKSGTVGGFFRISKTQNLSIDLNIELYTSVIALYDVDTVSKVRVEIWKENIFSFFYHFSHFLLFFYCLHFFHPPPHFRTKKLIIIRFFSDFYDIQ